ncbi:cholinesterase 1-like isoform X3 [Rhynchophorus ferrugineus]|uniref:cholinesterase 1-like isoform X3 n=1 Tax=Rhynchophorus ferrugineus TaxID=354439 RepID=UPI003FCC7759
MPQKPRYRYQLNRYNGQTKLKTQTTVSPWWEKGRESPTLHLRKASFRRPVTRGKSQPNPVAKSAIQYTQSKAKVNVQPSITKFATRAVQNKLITRTARQPLPKQVTTRLTQPTQPPHLVTPWNDTYDATIEKHICYQVNADSLKENEDCLFVNVFTPKNLTKYPIDSNLTVMVWIHGGGFIQGTGYTIGGVGPKFFMDENVILVAFNYRLGPFGFLSTGDDVITGNLGLKDQMFALKWVQKNIQYFGGDSEKVTIFGQSAGSASVAYQLLSPQSKGLYRAAILESGSALSPWAYQRYAKNISYLTAKYIDADFNGSNSEELLDFLMAVPASSIDKASATLNSEYETPYNFQISKGFFYAPVIEHEHEGAFLSEPMYELFEFGRYNNVPVIIGMNAEESLGLLEQNLTNLWKAYDDHPEVLVPFDMHVNDEKLTQVLGQKIYEFFSEGSSFESSLANSIKENPLNYVYIIKLKLGFFHHLCKDI